MNMQAGAVVGGVRATLRLEGVAVLLVALGLYARADASWWQFALLFLVPDLGLLGYLAGARVGAFTYNAVHTYVLPLALWALAPEGSRAAAIALIWFAHIGLDRAIGYGLKYGDGFGATHLGRVGRSTASAKPA